MTQFGHILLSSLPDTVIDTVKLLPFLFVTYLIMEWLEDRAQSQSIHLLGKFSAAGPLVGAALGAIPQCGFSAAAASLYSGGLITAGTLIAIFLSTSDEMLPILLSAKAPAATIGKILLAKFILGMVSGFAIDGIYRLIRKRRAFIRGTAVEENEENRIHELCENDHCGCEEEGHSPVVSALKHTGKISIFIFIITYIAAVLVESFGEQSVAAFLQSNQALGILISGAIGLIPNCGASVLITTLYLDSLISAGQMMTGLLVGAGVGLLVLFRTNRRHMATNFKLLALTYAAGVFWGAIIEILGLTF